MMMFLFEQADPQFRVADLVTEKGMPLIEAARTGCAGDIRRQITALQISEAAALKPDARARMQDRRSPLHYSTLKLKGPVFMGAGGKDDTVPAPGQERLFKDACQAGTSILYEFYPDLDHGGVVNGSVADSTPFVKKAFAGEAIAGNCPK